MNNKPGKLKIDVKNAKVIGSGGLTKDYKAGKAVKVDKHRLDPGAYVIFFAKNVVKVIDAKDLHDIVEFT